MKKDDLKSLVTQMHKELLQSIDSHEETSNSYKEIARESISAYKQTNGQFIELNKLQQIALEDVKDHLIDIPTINEKLNEIQLHITDEISRANSIITQLSKQIRDLEEDSNLDALTKVFNKRALDKYLEDVTSKEKLNSELYLLILDIDDFKTINDTYGHIVGDKILIFIANLLRNILRDGDKVFRYGGEEFVIILNRITAEKCEEIAKRILNTVSTNTLVYKGDSVNVTLSIGATKYCNGDTSDKIIDRADQALYYSKHNGKNQLKMEFKNGN
jgi:diguanylate cyclase (GGDEF)-like protein